MIEDKDLLNLSRQVLPGGVNSPVRAFLELGGAPPVLVRGEGPLVFDRNGKSYVDFVLGYGPHILGHAHPEIVSAITEAGKRSACLGLSSEDEILFAAELLESLIHMDMIRFVNSGFKVSSSIY